MFDSTGGQDNCLEDIMADFKLTPQESITFLQEFIDSINDEIDTILDGENFKRRIKSLKFRIELITREKNPQFENRLSELKLLLEEAEAEFKVKNPQVESLEAERSYYRKLLNEVSAR